MNGFLSRTRAVLRAGTAELIGPVATATAPPVTDLPDPLTGLPDRAALRRRIESELAREVAASTGAVLKLGIDNQRSLNASHGWTAGDGVLKAVAAALWGGVEPSASVARIEGDTFGVLLPDAGLEEAERIAIRLLDAVRSVSVTEDGTPVHVTASAGVAPVRGFDRTWDAIVTEADLALSLAKQSGRDRVRAYSPHLRRELAARSTWGAQIRKALDAGELRLLHQPVVDAASGAVVQHELLIRLVPDHGELIPPAAFFPVAERFGMLERIDRWVVEQAIALIAAPGGPAALEINVSTRSISDPGFLDLVRRRVAESGIDAAALIFEINEPTPTEDLERLREFAHQLRAIGCRFALDNFGVGYASLSLLKILPVDFVKLDGRFIRHLTSDAGDRALVRAVAGLASEMGMRSVATFVGDDETAALAAELGVDLLQGFHIGMPEAR